MRALPVYENTITRYLLKKRKNRKARMPGDGRMGGSNRENME